MSSLNPNYFSSGFAINLVYPFNRHPIRMKSKDMNRNQNVIIIHILDRDRTSPDTLHQTGVCLSDSFSIYGAHC